MKLAPLRALIVDTAPREARSEGDMVVFGRGEKTGAAGIGKPARNDPMRERPASGISPPGNRVAA